VIRVAIDRSAAAFIHQRLDVYVFDGPRQLILDPDGTERWEILESAETVLREPRPTLRVPAEVATEIAAAILDVAPANREQAQALADARAVRDRLLVLVEKVVAES
jgi:hypothetical protein